MVLSANGSARSKKLIVGLGNPGPEYARNRHNVGSQCLNTFARRHGVELSQRLRYARVGEGLVRGQGVFLAVPRAYVNESGEAVAALVRRFKILAQNLVIVYDDLDLPLGRIRVRPRGSPGGHKGMESIVARLGTQEFPRIRVGIGRPIALHEVRTRRIYEEEIVRWVLSDFTPEEEVIMGEVRDKVTEAVLCIVTEDVEAAMNRFN